MLVLTGAEVARLLPWAECIEALESAFGTWGSHNGGPPPFGALGLGGFHVKAAVLGGYYAAKVNGNFPGNPARGLPTIQGVLVLCDATTGTPLAIMDSAEITRRRTAAATAVAARWLALPDAASVALIGCGAQAWAQLEALRTVRDVRRVQCVDLVAERAAALAERCGRAGLVALAGDDAGAAARASDVIVTCTTSRRAILGAADVLPGSFVAAVGADHPEKREIASDLMAAARVVADVAGQAAAFGDLHHALADGTLGAGAAVELGQIVAGRARGRASRGEIVVFDSTGMALEDAAAAAVVYEQAVRAGAGTAVDLAGGARRPFDVIRL